jgi:hypothetical protein
LEKNEVDVANKASETVCALKWVRPLLISLKKPQPIRVIPIDVVAVNYAVFAISI